VIDPWANPNSLSLLCPDFMVCNFLKVFGENP
jgi:hypothetical protein